MTCFHNEGSDQPAHQCNLMRTFVVRINRNNKKTVAFSVIQKMHSVGILIRLHECAGRSVFCWVHMSEGTFSDVVAPIKNTLATLLCKVLIIV